MQVDTTVLGCTAKEAQEKPYIASMGIYVFKRTALIEMLENNPSHMDFGGEVIPEAQKAGAPLSISSPVAMFLCITYPVPGSENYSCLV